MLQHFKSFIQKEKLFSSGDKILLAVSGGIDSVVMCDLFNKSRFSFSIAHCNFKLREKESDKDVLFVKKLAQNYKVEFYTQNFETTNIANTEHISIQMAARALRYKWLEKIRKDYNYNFIATAHHKNDVIETVLINLIRGTGIAGLHGIAPKNNKVVRPILFATKNDINNYAQLNNLSFREDSSNKSTKYIRNKLRHNVIPVLKEINPNLEETFLNTVDRIKDIEIVLSQVFKDTIKNITEYKDEDIIFDIDKLKALHPAKLYLYEILCRYNFNGNDIENILNILNSQSGKQFFSSTHRLIKDRKKLIITEIKSLKNITTKITEKQTDIENDFLKLKCEKIKNQNFAIPVNPKIACLDLQKLKFPLVVRKWANGDVFYPLGMNHKKKLSDFFIDYKIPIHEKDKIQVLISDKTIAWVIGYRIDNRFKVTSKTQIIYHIEQKSH